MPYDSTSAVKPYIPAEARLPEMTVRALLMGVVLGVVFGASSLAQVAPGLTVDASKLTATARLQGPQAAADSRVYKVWQKADTVGGPAGKYLVGDDGRPAYLVDPGINGTHHTRPDGSAVKKYDAPKAVLMSYIIKGILDQQLPWTLVLLGVMIAVVLEMSGVQSLAFSVGVYLPLVSTLPIAVGGGIRWLVDRRNNQVAHNAGLTEEELQAAGDRSAGTLLASGYAGGALAGIVIAITAGVMTDFDSTLTAWAGKYNPFFGGADADLLSMIPYAGLCVLLYWIGRERAKT